MSPAQQLERLAPAAPAGAGVALAPGVIVHPQVPGGASGRLVELSNRRLARVGDDVGVLLDLMAECGGPVRA
jgi:hypothetical protein